MTAKAVHGSRLDNTKPATQNHPIDHAEGKHRVMLSVAFSGTDSRDDQQGSTGWESGFERQVDRCCPRDLSYFAQVQGVFAGSSQRDTGPSELLPPERFPRFRDGLRRPSLQILFRKLGVDRAGRGGSSRRCPPSASGGGPAPWSPSKSPLGLGPRGRGAWDWPIAAGLEFCLGFEASGAGLGLSSPA